ncbi:AbiJ-NTD4 domain-containing protein [Mariniflexile sp. HMF6888]|uniref:AbiJ-NTD4 domain-containing protein n=1 Tax=Mariniflexile sp. HMF6888 TaxID=3373086 RepID=UPI0037B0BE9D
MKFSERIGETEVRSVLQKDSIDDALKIKLWNCFFNKVIYRQKRSINTHLFDLTKMIWEDFYLYRVNEFPGEKEALKIYEKNFFKSDWHEVYDFIEFVVSLENNIPLTFSGFIDNCNLVLEKELSAYRIINNQITPISDEVEMESIENASKSNDKFKEVSTHLKASVSSLSNRENPDYRNSIKESISAVESICKIITGENTLGKALNNLEKSGIKINPSLKSAFEKLYTYTNDSKTGIRHALVEGDYSPDFDEAKFMLVTCSTFINYLKAKAV